MILDIVQAGVPVLRQKAREIAPQEIRGQRVQDLIESMRETMRNAPGVGLAAPQIGLPLAMAVIEDRPEYLDRVTEEQRIERGRAVVPFHVIINPRLTIEDITARQFFEGCLSVTGMLALVARHERVRVDALDHRGEPVTVHASGWHARILQHEIDHLGGILFVERMNARSFMTQENFLEHYASLSVHVVVESLLSGDSP